MAVSIVGFIITIISTWIAKSAAQAAEQAARRAHNGILRSNVLVDFSETVDSLEEIIRLQINREWNILSYRYQEIIKCLHSIKSVKAELAQKDRERIQNTIVHITDISDKVNKILYAKKNLNQDEIDQILDVPFSNEILNKQINYLNEMLAKIKNEMV